MKLLKIALVIFVPLTLVACGSTKVTTTAYTPLEEHETMIPDARLLDIGVIPLDPGLDRADEDDETLLPELRNAEGRFIADRLASTIQNSAAWGVVRVVPGTRVNYQSNLKSQPAAQTSAQISKNAPATAEIETPDVRQRTSFSTVMDVYVEGTIIHSDGETMALEITVTDTSGTLWYTREYEEVVGKYAYEKRSNNRDPFQGLFNRIANDLLTYQNTLPEGEAERLRIISELRFARNFSPEAFDEYISEDPKKGLVIIRLPAANDPLLERIRRIRTRDDLFIDTLQEHYHIFAKRMERPYQDWRRMSYDEIVAVRKLKRESTIRTIAGIGAILVGIAAAGGNNGSSQAAGAVAIGSGGMLIKSGLSKRQEAQIHVEALTELGASLEAEIEPQVIELEDRTITLTGSVDAQYEQWKAILQQIFEQERGEI